MSALNVSLAGRTALVTGGTGGIGLATARGLATLGATVLAVGRDRARGEAAVAAIREASGNPSVELLLADMASQAAIRRLARDVRAHHPRLHVLVNNVAGLYAERRETADRIEATLAVSHLAPFLLTHLLLPALQAEHHARIINVSSSGHRFAHLALDDLQSTQGYRGVAVYNRAKLANLLFSFELARRLAGTGITVNAADPFGAFTALNQELTPHTMGWPLRATLPFLKVLRPWMTTSRAAQTSIYLAAAPEVAGVSGRYFFRGRPVRPSRRSADRAMAARLWTISETLTALVPDERLMPASPYIAPSSHHNSRPAVHT